MASEAACTRELIRTSHNPARAVMPAAEATVLWLRTHLPERAEEIIGRARERYHRLADQPVATAS